MDPVAKADRQTASKFFPLKAVCDALENRAGKSKESVKEFVARLIAGGHYRHSGSEAPPPHFCRGHPSTFTFDGSDITDNWCDRGYPYKLRDVSLFWEAVVAACPELGAEPPELGKSRFEVSFAPPLMKWFETLVGWLRRKSPPAKEEPEVSTPTSALSTRLQEMERAGLFRGAPALQDAADYARDTYSSEGRVPDDVTPAQFARGLEGWLKARDKKKAPGGQWQTSNRFLQEYRRRS
jgi:hypothetical protein